MAKTPYRNDADYVVVGSDLQLLATGLRTLAGSPAPDNDNSGGT